MADVPRDVLGGAKKGAPLASSKKAVRRIKVTHHRHFYVGPSRWATAAGERAGAAEIVDVSYLV